ncbi:MAG: hypothetical protein LW805_10030 [Oxalobacteraceae bacterium]|nr:hypothetical protein [Oxalobacteraceae bacterium]
MKISPLPQFAHAPLLLLITAMMMMQPLSTDLYLASLPSLVRPSVTRWPRFVCCGQRSMWLGTVD